MSSIDSPVTLVGFAALPADTFADGDLSEAELRDIYGDLVDLVDFDSDPIYDALAVPKAIAFISTYADGFIAKEELVDLLNLEDPSQ